MLDDDNDWEIDPENLKMLVEKYKSREFPLFMDDVPRKRMINLQLKSRKRIWFSCGFAYIFYFSWLGR